MFFWGHSDAHSLVLYLFSHLHGRQLLLLLLGLTLPGTFYPFLPLFAFLILKAARCYPSPDFPTGKHAHREVLQFKRGRLVSAFLSRMRLRNANIWS